ncbi:MAG TPA: GGDEF domain-containing protein [Thermoleophilaceae bacterium]|jgi:diguanylate cyclase (GGDEF)-like protein|nr:GGDEF domain-containing protein [Thermoleophilaceae bacterium]
MAPIPGSLARLDRSRDELAKAWLVRLIESASLDEIRELPTDRLARELPELIGDIVGRLSLVDGRDPYELSDRQAERASVLVGLRGGRSDESAADLARDVASLQTVLIQALRHELEGDPDGFAHAVEQLADATGAIQAAATEALVRTRSRELESQANTDPLTGLANLRALQRQLGRHVALQKRYGHRFSVLLLDVDGLKRVNDAHGHQAGDRVLMQVAMSVRRGIRTVDTAARLGGDEFCVLAPEQDGKSAASLAERLKSAVGEEVAMPDEAPVAISVGVAACPEHGKEAEDLIELADRAMYRAKASGEGVALSDPPSAELAEEASP